LRLCTAERGGLADEAIESHEGMRLADVC
jgi:hypothetical protein